MKRKFYLLFTALLMMATTSAWADVFTLHVDDNGNNVDPLGVQYTLNTSAGTAQVAYQRTYDGEALKIPAQVKKDGTTYDVTSIARDAFEGCKFTSISFDKETKITRIENWTFGKCPNLTKIEIPEGITYIGGCAFTHNTALEEVILPSTLETLSDHVFQKDTNLKTVIIKSSSINSFDKTAFCTQRFYNEYSVLVNATIVVPDANYDYYKSLFDDNGYANTYTSLVPVAAYNKGAHQIMWNVVDNNNKIIASETLSGYVGYPLYPTKLLSADDVTLYPSSYTPAEETNTVTSTYTDKGRVLYSSSYKDAHWYRMTIRNTSKYCYYDNNKWCVNTDNATTDNEAYYQFAFVGDPFNGFKLYNKGAGNYPFKSESGIGKSDYSLGNEAQAATFKFKDVNNSQTFRIVEILNGTEYYLNNLDGGNSVKIGIWNADGAAKDGGGLFYISTPTQSGVEKGGLYYDLNSNGTATLTTGNQEATGDDNGAVTIPSYVNYGGYDYKVTSIANGGFQGASFTSLKFESPCYITTIGDWNFAKCDMVWEVILPDGVEALNTANDNTGNNRSFSLMDNLRTVVLPQTLTTIGDYAFAGDKNLSTIIINSSNLSALGQNIFDGITVGNITIYVPDDDTKTTLEGNTQFSDAKIFVMDKNTIFYVHDGSAYDRDNNVVKGTTCDNLVLTDGYSFAPAGDAFTATNATYSRKMGTWGTLVLPFTVKSDENVQIYTVKEINASGDLIVESAESLTAGTPGIIKRLSKDSVVTFTATNAENVSASITNNSLLVGSYTQDNLIQNTANAYYIYGDKFYKNGGSFYADAFRAYLVNSGTPSPAFNILVDDDPTGINGAATDDAADEIEGVYSVSGVKQSDLQKGINIVRYRSGKTQKVILK